jgi:hypothetical protein
MGGEICWVGEIVLTTDYEGSLEDSVSAELDLQRVGCSLRVLVMKFELKMRQKQTSTI